MTASASATASAGFVTKPAAEPRYTVSVGPRGGFTGLAALVGDGDVAVAVAVEVAGDHLVGKPGVGLVGERLASGLAGPAGEPA